MKSIRFQPGSKIFVAAREVQNGEEFNGLTVVIGDVWRSIENGNGSEPGWIELFWVFWRFVNEINQVSARLKHICSRHGGSKWRRIQWPNSGYRNVWRSIENGNGSEPGWIELF